MNDYSGSSGFLESDEYYLSQEYPVSSGSSMDSTVVDSPMCQVEPEYCFVFVVCNQKDQSATERANGPTYCYFMQQAIGKIELFKKTTSNVKFTKKSVACENLPGFLKENINVDNEVSDTYGNSQEIRSFVTSQHEYSSKYIFVLDSFRSECFKTLGKEDNLKIIGPLVILYWAKMMESANFNLLDQLKDIPFYGLFSKCMTNIEVCFSQNVIAEQKLMTLHLLRWMDGKVTSELGMDTTHVVAELGHPQSSSDPTIRAAILFHLPILPLDWIIDCWNSFQATKKMASDNEYIQAFTKKHTSVCQQLTDPPKLLKEMVIGYVMSVVDRSGGPVAYNKFNSVVRVVTQLGGTMVSYESPMHRQQMSMILHPDDIFPDPFTLNGIYTVDEVNRANLKVLELYNSDVAFVRVKELWNRDVPIISIKWLFHTIMYGAKQPLEKYKVQRYPANHSFARMSSRPTLPVQQQPIVRPEIPAYGTVRDRSRDNFHFGL